jgi:hypothetical protein
MKHATMRVGAVAGIGSVLGVTTDAVGAGLLFVNDGTNALDLLSG